jgi:hypothetical protein
MPSQIAVVVVKAASDVTNKAGVLATLDIQVTALTAFVAMIEAFKTEGSWPESLRAYVKDAGLGQILANISVVRTGINANLT